jgi:hypothetical protein
MDNNILKTDFYLIIVDNYCRDSKFGTEIKFYLNFLIFRAILPCAPAPSGTLMGWIKELHSFSSNRLANTARCGGDGAW